MAATYSNYPHVKPENCYFAMSSSWNFVDASQNGVQSHGPPHVPSPALDLRGPLWQGHFTSSVPIPPPVRDSQTPQWFRRFGSAPLSTARLQRERANRSQALSPESFSSTQRVPLQGVSPRSDPVEPMYLNRTWNSVEAPETRGALGEARSGNYPLPVHPQVYDVDFKQPLHEAPHREAAADFPTYRFFRRSVNRPVQPVCVKSNSQSLFYPRLRASPVSAVAA